MTASTTKPKLTTIATLPEHYFLENLAVRSDGSMLVTALNRGEVWWVPAPTPTPPSARFSRTRSRAYQ